MIDYETYCRIHDCRDRQGLKASQIADALGLHRSTVSHWLARPRFEARKAPPRATKLDAFKARIAFLLDSHPFSAQQIYQRLREEGYTGGVTRVREHVARMRPGRKPVYLKLQFAPGECAQVDWGEYGTIAVGNTRRRLSFFVMVLAYSRLMYVEFTVSQTIEHFLGCHVNAFRVMGGVPRKLMVDNLKSAVLKRLIGEAPVFNPRYLELAKHYGFAIEPCTKGRGNEKGRVESGVGYVKKNFLNGLEVADFIAIGPAAKLWLDDTANVRQHGETQRRPVDLFEEEKAHLKALNPNAVDSRPELTQGFHPILTHPSCGQYSYQVVVKSVVSALPELV